MESRRQVEERIYISKPVKQKILEKSKGRCAHCGKKIEVGNGFTLEHVVPISKGGTNDIENLVALCNECNHGKSNDVIKPKEYYGYVKKEVMKELEEYFRNYCNVMQWITINNMYSADVFSFITDKVIYNPKSKKYLNTKTNVTFKKAKPRDKQMLLDFFLKQKEMFDRDGKSIDNVNESLDFAMDYYCIYYYKIADEISMVIVISPYCVNSTEANGEILNIYVTKAEIYLNDKYNLECSTTDRQRKGECLRYFFSQILARFYNYLFNDLTEELSIECLFCNLVNDRRINYLYHKLGLCELKQEVIEGYSVGIGITTNCEELKCQDRSKHAERRIDSYISGQNLLHDVLVLSNLWEKPEGSSDIRDDRERVRSHLVLE